MHFGEYELSPSLISLYVCNKSFQNFSHLRYLFGTSRHEHQFSDLISLVTAHVKIKSPSYVSSYRAPLVAQLVKNLPAMQETWFNSWVGKIRWRRDRLPTPIFLEFPGGSAGKESSCNAGALGSITIEKIPWRRKQLPTSVFWPGEFHGLYSSWSLK